MPRLVTVHSKVTKKPRRPYEKERLDQVRSPFTGAINQVEYKTACVGAKAHRRIWSAEQA